MWRRGRVRRWRSQRGAAAVGFALLLPLLVVILFGVFAVGVALVRGVNYVSAAREGARYAAVHCRPDSSSCTPTLIQTRVMQSANGNPIGPGTPAADIDCTV